MTTETAAPPFEPFRQRAEAALRGSLGDHLERMTWGAERLGDWRTARLRRLLAHAIERSPFHAERLAGIDAASFTLDQLDRLPVMDKATMMDRFDDVVTDRRLRRADLEAIIEATGDEPIPAVGEFLVLTSGGSSGERGIFVMDVPALAEFCAQVMRPGVAASLAQGGPPPGGLAGAMVGAPAPIHATGAGPLITGTGPVRMTRIPATLPFDEIVDRLHAVDPDLLTAYPSVLVRLARAQRSGRLDVHPAAITSTSENLVPDMRTEIEEAFGVPLADLFGSTEGLIGISLPGEATLNFASDCCIVELVDEDDQPVVPGQPSASVLVTNLFNLAQPLIRYRMDDRFVEQPPVPEHGHLRAVVDGRASDTFRWGDIVVHPLAVTSELTHTPSIVDHIVRQTPTGVDVSVVAVAPVDIEDLRSRIATRLVQAGFEKPDVAITEIDDIGRHPHTGKVSRIVPLPAAR